MNFFEALRRRLRGENVEMPTECPPAKKSLVRWDDECTEAHPNRLARYHQGSNLVGTVQRRDGDHEQYRCGFCGATWEH